MSIYNRISKVSIFTENNIKRSEHSTIYLIVLSKCITTIINQSLTSGIFPNSLKIAKVTSISKQDVREAY